MKAKHIRLDGTIEYEGTPEEIGRLLREINNPPKSASIPFTVSPICNHKWPAVWMSVSPPSCEKCGMQATGGQFWEVTATTCMPPFNLSGCSSANIPGHTAITVDNSEPSQ